jgi:hypothetical protein
MKLPSPQAGRWLLESSVFADLIFDRPLAAMEIIGPHVRTFRRLLH